MVRALVTFLASILRSALALLRSRENQDTVELALRQQLAIYVHKHPRPRLSPLDRAFWVALSRVWPRWRTALVVVRPETVIRWHRKAFRGYWSWISKPGPGRPRISEEAKALIVPGLGFLGHFQALRSGVISGSWRAGSLRPGTGNFSP